MTTVTRLDKIEITKRANMDIKEYRIYYNATRKLYSVQHKTDKGWRLLGHYKNILAKFSTTKVSDKIRQRVVAEKRKYVHAWICTNNFMELTDNNSEQHSNRGIVYNPYKHLQFMLDIDGNISKLDTDRHDMLMTMVDGRPKISLQN